MSSLNLKSKDLIGIPWMFAFAMRADGWYLRSEIIWHKTNPMPESIKDRPTRSHEQIFMFTKSRKYYYDHEAIREPAVYPGDDRIARVKSDHKSYPDAKKNGIRKSRSEGHYTYDLNTRNKRDVWTVSTKPYKGAHFATYPPELIEPCILAGSRPGDLVLDPFAGSGTTGAVALKHGRRAVLCELNSDYVPLIEERLRSVNYGDQ